MTQSNYKRPLFWLLLGALFFLFLYEIRSILLPFVVGVLAAYFLDPAADRLERMGIPRGIATAFITLFFFLAIIVACALIMPLLAHQLTDLLSEAPDYIVLLQEKYGAQWEAWLARIGPDQVEALRSAAQNMAGNAMALTAGLFTQAVYSGFALLNLLSLLLITPLVMFYLLRDWDAITGRLDRLLPVAHAPTIREQLARIDETLAGFIRGQINVCFLLALYYAVALSLTGLNFGLLIGLASGVLVVLPYVGFSFMCIIALAVALLQFGFALPFWAVAGIYGGGQLIESYFLTPKLVGNRVGLHPLWIIFGMLAGAALFGFVGVLLAVPLTAVIGVLIRFAVERYRMSALYRGV